MLIILLPCIIHSAGTLNYVQTDRHAYAQELWRDNRYCGGLDKVSIEIRLSLRDQLEAFPIVTIPLSNLCKSLSDQSHPPDFSEARGSWAFRWSCT